MGSISLERVLLPYFFRSKNFEKRRSLLFTVSHFGSANITIQTAICQVGSPRRSPRFLNKSENRQNSLQFILHYYSAFCLNRTFKTVRIHSETQVLVAPLRRKEKDSKILISKRNLDFLFSERTQKTAEYYRYWCSKRWSKRGGVQISTE